MSASLSYDVSDLFISTSLEPLKYLMNQAAGYTTSEVPPIINTSA